jgi:hypothetical protein
MAESEQPESSSIIVRTAARLRFVSHDEDLRLLRDYGATDN